MADVLNITSGPWEVVNDRRMGRDRMVDVFSIAGRTEKGGRVFVVTQAAFSNCEHGRANAHLIAAAPDGYEFADAFDQHFTALYGGPNNTALTSEAANLWRQCRDFLAKARGEQVAA